MSLAIWRSLIVLSILTAGCSSETTKRREATCSYWARLSRICTQFDVAIKALGKATTTAGHIEHSVELNKLYLQMSDDIAQLPTSFVDADVVALSADYIQASNEVNILMHDMVGFLKRRSELQSASGTALVAIESLIRGFMGDPLGTAKEFSSASQELSDDGAKILARWADMQQRAAAFSAREVRLRSALSERYRSDFPPLTPPRKPD